MQAISAPEKQSKRIIYLDYLRILSCLGVFACHLWISGYLYYLSQTIDSFNQLSSECLGIHGDSLYRCGLKTLFILPNENLDYFLFNFFNLVFGLGYQAVHLFFLLSGFGLTLSVLLDEKKRNKIKWFDFLKKRFMRLYPSYWVLLAVYMASNLFLYRSFLGFVKTYLIGSIFLNNLPATWFLPVLIQLYLIFPLLFRFLKKSSLKKFLLSIFFIKVISSALIIITSLIVSGEIAGFGYGALAPGGIALTRIFEFCLGMAIARIFVDKGCSIQFFRQFCKPIPILLGFFLEVSGLLMSMKFTVFNFAGHSIPAGLFVSDAFIGIGVFILSLNFIFLVHSVLKYINSNWIYSISNLTYEAYLIHGCILSYFLRFIVEPSLDMVKTTNNYFIICLLFLATFLMFSFLSFLLASSLFTFKIYLGKQWSRAYLKVRGRVD